MQKFLRNIIRFALLPVCILVFLLIVYCILDPFKVLYKYDNFFDKNSSGTIGLNKDYVSTENFTSHYKSANYNSFIFGNSRSFNYKISDWQIYLEGKNNCYHFDAANETLFGIEKKIRLLNRLNIPIENALLVLDRFTLQTDQSRPGHLFIISPRLVDNSNFLEFHWTHFRTFLSPVFLYAFTDFKLSGQVKPYMQQNFLINSTRFSYDPVSNEITMPETDSLIRSGNFYTPEILNYFYKRDSLEKISPPVIFENQKKLLHQINDVLISKRTTVKLIISPLYDQERLNPADLIFLQNVFGKENVYDFSGINPITSDYRNYYESSHYRSETAAELMQMIYSR